MLDDLKNAPAVLRSLSEVVAEYESKRDSIGEAIKAFGDATTALQAAASVGGTYGGPIWDGGRSSYAPNPYEKTLSAVLLKSAWEHVISGLQINKIATAKDKSKLRLGMENPPEFTIDNIRATLGKYLIDPRQHVLRGVAEAFCDLDPAYKSHSKVKIGVQGLPKRIIMTSVLGEFGGGWRADQLRDVLNAMAALHELPRLEYAEYDALLRASKRGDDPEFLGVTLRGFQNGNMHLIFDPESLRLINLALAEFYGDVLPDAPEENAKRQPGTAVSKDLQFYPTPAAVVETVLSDLYFKQGESVLEPSCGDGRLMDGLAALGKGLCVTGIEYDPARAAECRAKGHHVQTANFLQVAPQPIFDAVVMNPPFYGRHYLKHIRHALKFLKPGGRLLSILPATAHYDHGELPAGKWHDLPVGSFSESGTNVPTGYFVTHAPEVSR